MDERLDRWDPHDCPGEPPFSPSSTLPTEIAIRITFVNSPVQRVLTIGELLDGIIRAATPEAQLVAYNVSLSWRAMAKYIIESKMKTGLWSMQHPCVPVAYGEPINPAFAPPEPSPDEVERFRKDLAAAHAVLPSLSETHNEIVSTFFPARITQASLSTETAASLEIFTQHQEELINNGIAQRIRALRREGKPYQHLYPTFGTPGSPVGQPGPHVPKWLEFTQFSLNPYFSGLLPNRITIYTGRIDITMPCRRVRTMTNRSISRTALRDMIETTQLTQPPCKIITLHLQMTMCDERVICNIGEFEEIVDEDGVKVGTLLRVLEEYQEDVTFHWFEQAEYMRKSIIESHWKQDLWFVPNSPRISIVLNNIDRGHTRRAQWSQLLRRDSRLSRQGEWMPRDMMKPPKSLADNDTEVLPGAYSIGLKDNPFTSFQAAPWDRRAV